MTTARDFCELALTTAGVLGVGQTALPQDINNTLTFMNAMIAQWQKKRWLVPSLYEVSAIGDGSKSNAIGPGQYYNAARPDKIQTAYFVQLNTDTNNPVSFPLRQIFSWEDYALVALKEMNSWPLYFFYDGAFPYGNVYIWPIPSSSYEIHLVMKSPIGFNVLLEDGIISDGGSGYVDGAYVTIPLTSDTGVGSGATADITVAGGIVTVVTVTDGASGDGYKIGDLLSVDNSNLGGTGTGFVYETTNVTSSLDAEFNMPPEYEEAILFNLARRLLMAYRMPADPEINKTARAALSTLRRANVQIPTLKIPAALRFNNNGSFYIYNADAF